MNLDKLNHSQRECTMQMQGPLVVSAGAGSGKTFTLTQRIVYALSLESGPAVRGINHVLAITYTEKAAEELKVRIKRTLRSEGMSDQALRVDEAWIGTIHGMCSRILHENALDLGFDPRFEILSELDAAELLTNSIEECLHEGSDIVEDREFAALLDEYPAVSAGYNQTSVTSLVEEIIKQVSQNTAGFDNIKLFNDSHSIEEILKHLYSAYCCLENTLTYAKETKTNIARLDNCRSSKEILGNYLNLRNENPLSNERELIGALEVLDSCAVPGLTGLNGDPELKAEVKSLQLHYAMACAYLSLLRGNVVANDLIDLSKKAYSSFQEKKRKLSFMDNDDLLLETYRALTKYPHIAEKYQENFDLIMVDEFQDTSLLQVKLIELLCKEGSSNLCTVGDEQQSIYRFRGADVDVYRQHKKEAVKISPLNLKKLDTNYRSSAEILSFVDKVFAHRSSSYMKLMPDANRKEEWLYGSRIRLIVTEKTTNISSSIASEANMIAEQFYGLYKTGSFKQSDMVILLGKMSSADTYAQAIRSKGLECVIAGGSVYSQAEEVNVMSSLAQILTNPSDTQSLHDVLSSDMFSLGANDFLDLASVVTEDGATFVKRQDIYKGLLIDEQAKERMSEVAQNASEILSSAQRIALTSGLYEAMKQALVKSGWLDRAQSNGASGASVAGNIFKTLRFVKEFENEGMGCCACASRLKDFIASNPKETPGVINAKSGDAVRIMTIHSSKGLEFPVVAVSQYDSMRSASLSQCTTVNDTVYLSLRANNSINEYNQIKSKALKLSSIQSEQFEWDELYQNSMVKASLDLATWESQKEFEELERKLYVALTRASECLILTLPLSKSAKGELSTSPFAEGIYGALGLNDLSSLESLHTLNYGGHMPAEVLYTKETHNEGPVACVQVNTMVVPERLIRDTLPVESQEDKELSVFSYSALASHLRKEEDCESANRAFKKGNVDVGENPFALGNAFHRAAQYAAEQKSYPSQQQIDTYGNIYELSTAQKERLVNALNLWFASDLFKAAMSAPVVMAEVPFRVPIGNKELIGDIDLLCLTNPIGNGKTAVLFDYKTGGEENESDEELYHKHLLQAKCYAYALIKEGYNRVEAHFLRVEHVVPGAHAKSPLEVVDYVFSDKDVWELAHDIEAAYQTAVSNMQNSTDDEVWCSD